jgi:hypothetical protein
VLDFREARGGALRALVYELDGLERTVLVASERFIVERVQLEAERRGVDLDGMPLVVQALGAPLEIEARGETVRLEPYQTAIVPAAFDVAMLRGFAADNDGDPESACLIAAPPADRDALDRRLGRAGIPDVRVAEFLTQF